MKASDVPAGVVGVEDADGLSAGEVDAATLDLGAELPEARIAREQQRLQTGSNAVAYDAEDRRVGAAVLVERNQFARLPAFGISDSDLVAGLDLDQ